MAKQTILIIEDEKNIQELVRYNLEQEGYAVLVAGQGDVGLGLAIKKKPDLVILDLMLPELDGTEICKTLKQNNETAHIAIIMLTAKSEEIDKVLGLELGADDYMTKPFSPRELVARVKAVLRRGSFKLDQEHYQVGELELDDKKHKVKIQGESVSLTSKEYDLLKTLLSADGRVLTREFLLENVWGYEQSVNIETRTVDIHIGQLRKKLTLESKRIATIKNVGYRFDLES